MRSLVWSVSGSFSKATRTASAAGRGSASLFFAGAVALILSGHFVYGFWALFIGGFLWVASRQYEKQLRFRDSLAGLKASDLMILECPRIEVDVDLAGANEKFLAHPASACALVLERGSLRGLLNRVQIDSLPPQQRATTAVEVVMTPLPALRRVRPDQDIVRILETMEREGLDYVTVFGDSELLGILGRQEIFQFLRHRFQATS